MELDNVRIVLVETSHPGNIGSVARAMKTMGFGELYLVNPKIFPCAKATEMASGADDILQQAKVVDTLEEAIGECQYVIGTSARLREMSVPVFTPRESAVFCAEKPTTTKFAIVFGRESSGLNNQELLKCNYHVYIPTNEAYRSLNIAAAVQILCYELRVAMIAEPAVETAHEIATIRDVEGFYQHLEHVLKALAFYKPKNPKRLFQRLRRLFNRIQLEVLEVNILRGILTAIEKKLSS